MFRTGTPNGLYGVLSPISWVAHIAQKASNQGIVFRRDLAVPAGQITKYHAQNGLKKGVQKGRIACIQGSPYSLYPYSPKGLKSGYRI